MALTDTPLGGRRSLGQNNAGRRGNPSGSAGRMGPPSNPYSTPSLGPVQQDQQKLNDALFRQRDNYLNQQMGWQNQGYGLGQNELNASYGFDNARLGLEQQALGVDRGAVQRQQSYYAQLFGIDTDRYNQAMGFQNALRGFRSTDRGSTLHQLAVQASQVRDRAMREERDMRRQQTAAGAFTSQGAKDSARDISADRDYGLRNVDIAKRQAETAYARDMAGFDNTMRNLTLDFKEAGLSNAEQQARLGDRLKTLDIEASKLGITRDELASKLALGLERLKLNHTVSTGQLLDAMAQNAIGNTNDALGSIFSSLGIRP